jgi:type I restriction enzyme S subunit
MIDISPRDLDIVCRILRKHVPDCEVWAFGSRAQRTAKTWSDLDLAVITDTPLPLEVRGALAEDFTESDLPFRVDVVDWATTEESFRRVVEQAKVVVQPGTKRANEASSVGPMLSQRS